MSSLLAAESKTTDGDDDKPDGRGSKEAGTISESLRQSPVSGEPFDISIDSAAIDRRVDGVRSGLNADHAQRLSAALSNPGSFNTDSAAGVGGSYAKQGASPAAYAATYLSAVESLVEAAFDRARGGDPDDAQAALETGLRTAFAHMVAGLERYEEVTERSTAEHADAVLTIEAVLEAVPFPIYILDAETRVIGWNYGHTALVGMTREEAIGKSARESVVKATYSEGARKLTLAEKVIEAPRNADEAFDIERQESTYCDSIVYYDSSTATNLNDEEVEIEFWAVPIFDDDGEFLAVFEILNDRTEEVHRQEALESLVGEVTTTLQSIGDGDLSARASFDDENDAVDEELLGIVEEVNGMAAEFDRLVGDVDERTAELAASIRDATETAHRVDRLLGDQNASLGEVAEEMQDFSATMEEIASSSNEVSNAAQEARNEVETGVDAAGDARAVADDVSEASEELVDTVTELADHMDEIEGVVEVISDIAEQTNILALNANIEAARAGDGSGGFAVVANEVKDLANQTQSYTEEIASHIDRIKAHSEETADAVKASHAQIGDVTDEVTAVVSSFEEIATSVEDAANGINDIADANEDQATRVEEVLSMVDDAQDDADAATDAAGQIVDEAEHQRDTVEQLESQVDALTDA
ncbi:MAG: methyl-accepting chemotaxis protein [Halobacteriota archaeon]